MKKYTLEQLKAGDIAVNVLTEENAKEVIEALLDGGGK